MLRTVLFISVLLSPAHADTTCACKDDLSWVLFAEDPVVSPDEQFHALIEATQIGIDVGDCVVWNTFADDVGEVPTYSNNGEEIKQLRWVALDGTEAYLSIAEVHERARQICFPATS
tara:strand:- start:799 stop:1149 length:351 start_codon:yes stop_codon:yes gene_type:complete